MHNPASAVVLSTLVAKTTIPLPWFLASSSLSTPRHHQSLNSATALCKIRYVTKEEIPWGWLSIPLRLSVPWWVWQPWLAPQSPFFSFHLSGWDGPPLWYKLFDRHGSLLSLEQIKIELRGNVTTNVDCCTNRSSRSMWKPILKSLFYAQVW